MPLPERDRRRFHPAAGDFLRVGAETFEQAVLDDDRQGEGDEDDQKHVLADHTLQQEALQAEAEQEGDREHDQGGDDRIKAEQRPQKQQRVARQHDEIAMRDVDETHHAGRKRKADGEQRIKAAEHHALEQLIGPDRDHHSLTGRNNAS